MQYLELAHAYEQLESTTKRLEMRTILVELLRPLEGRELASTLYLSQGLLRPEYEGVELGLADSLGRKAVAEATHQPLEAVTRSVRASGDLGTTTAALLARVGRLEETHPLSLLEVYDRLTEIARASGAGSQETKVRVLVELLRRTRPLEGKYLVRFVTGTLRVGVREMTILDALAGVFAPEVPKARERIEAAFNLTSDLGLVAQVLVESGIGGLDGIGIEVGRPIRPMLAEREPSLAAVLERLGGRAALEFKYDGLRVQAHVPQEGPVRLFSRRLEEIGAQFPELVAELPGAIRSRPAIVEGECVPVDPDTGEIVPFQAISRRRGRKHDLGRAQEEIPVCLYLFDVLLQGTTPTYQRTFSERRALLERLVRSQDRVRLAQQRIVSSVEEAQSFLDEAVAAGAEGVMAKSLDPGSGYRAGARGYWWIKYKRDYTTGLTDSIDGVVVGAFAGRGRRAGRWGAFLLAVYDSKADRFQSFTKVGTGFDDAMLAEMPERLKTVEVDDRPAEVESGLVPDRWMRPKIVLEVRGAELTVSPVHRAAIGAIRPEAGLALRFPRFTGRIRTDKSPAEATTSAELLKMYLAQVRHEVSAEDLAETSSGDRRADRSPGGT